MDFKNTLEFAQKLDAQDHLHKYQDEFIFPKVNNEKVIYFTDGLNSVRQVNLNKLEDYYSDAYLAWLNNPVDPFVGEKWNCAKFNLIQPL